MDKEIQFFVVISERAENNLDDIVNYLLIEWNEKVKNLFLFRLKKIVSLLAINPYLFQEYSKKRRIRKCLITKHNALYFRIIKNSVEIITIHDTRKNPKVLKI
jgi:plasmid stabilization system protein ParE